jgi:EAL domain-containing protein (putative c-di-GMP-specific phosphodiesterase class I)
MAMGVSLALDDFGKGYSGLDYLQSLPFSCLKIDKSFIDRIGVSERSEQIIRTALQLARTLGMSSVAEGIEDQATAQRLAGLGCVYAQGYHFGRPMPADRIADWARERA